MISNNDINEISQALDHYLTHLARRVEFGDLTIDAWKGSEAAHKRILADLERSASDDSKPKQPEPLVPIYHRECWECSDVFQTTSQTQAWCRDCINEQKGHSHDCI